MRYLRVYAPPPPPVVLAPEPSITNPATHLLGGVELDGDRFQVRLHHEGLSYGHIHLDARHLEYRRRGHRAVFEIQCFKTEVLEPHRKVQIGLHIGQSHGL